jgi:ribosomal protein L32
MIAEINGVVSSVRGLSDLVKANKTLTNFNELVAAVSEVNAKLITAQAAVLTSQEKQSTLSDRIRELEKEVAELKDWNRETERYQLTTIASGVVAYAIKPGMESGEPPHHLCANCFAHKEKWFLQNGPHGTGIVARCSKCGSTFFASGGSPAMFGVVSRK